PHHPRALPPHGPAHRGAPGPRRLRHHPVGVPDAARMERPSEVIDALAARYPELATATLHPADAVEFLDICSLPGKPVPFVPVIDGDVRRWWRSDSLWQAHDSRYDADAVCVIPGTTSVA